MYSIIVEAGTVLIHCDTDSIYRRWKWFKVQN
jgi:hypothetical protein